MNQMCAQPRFVAVGVDVGVRNLQLLERTLKFVLYLCLILSTCSIRTATMTTVEAIPSRRAVTRRILFPVKAQRRNRSSIHSRFQDAKSAAMAAAAHRWTNTKGTSFMFHRPTRFTAGQLLFGGSSGGAPHTLHGNGAYSNVFNHDMTGMTNPTLHVAVDDRIVMHIASSTTTMKSGQQQEQQQQSHQKSQDETTDNVWFPSTTVPFLSRTTTSTSTPSSSFSATLSSSSTPWHRREYHACMGYGRACYEQVRDLIFAREFETETDGMIRMSSLSYNNNIDDDDDYDDDGPSSLERNTRKSRILPPTTRPDNHHKNPTTTTINTTKRPNPIRQTSSQCGYDIVHTGAVMEDAPLYGDWHSTPSAMSIGDCPNLVTYTKVQWSMLFGRRKEQQQQSQQSQRRRLQLFPSIWIVNPCRVLYDIIDQRGGDCDGSPDGMRSSTRSTSTTYSCSSYATLRGHGLAGEERWCVTIRDVDGQVNVQLLSISKPATIWTKLGWSAIVKPLQHEFFTHQMEWLQQQVQQQQEQRKQEGVDYRQGHEFKQYTLPNNHDNDSTTAPPSSSLPSLSKPMPQPWDEPIMALPR